MNSFIDFLQKELDEFIRRKKGLGAADSFVVFTNLNNINENSNQIDNKIVASIVNIEEEAHLKTPENFIRTPTEILYRQPPVWINITCLFSFYSKSSTNYTGIQVLGQIVQYFQGHPKLDMDTVLLGDKFPEGLESVRAEFVNLNFEQANYLWSMFGGRYHPSVVYKFKSLPILDDDHKPGGPPILETQANALHKTSRT